MSSVNSVSNNQILADAVYGVEKQSPAQTSSNGLQELGTEIAFGVPITFGLVTMPKWGKYFTTPYSAWSYMRQNPYISYSQAYDFVTAEREREKLNMKKLTEGKGFWEKQNYKMNYNKVRSWGAELPSFDKGIDVSKLEGKSLLKYNNQKKLSGYYDEVRKLIEEAKSIKDPVKFKEQTQKILKAMQKADYKANYAKQIGLIKPTSKYGQAKHWLKSKTGYYKAKGAILKTPRGASALKWAGKGVKGTGLMAIIGVGLEYFTNIKPAQEIDKYERSQGRISNRASKQMVKSAVKAGSGILGYAAGAAAAGAVAGSVFPGIGNIAGAVIGFVGGCIGGFLAGKAADAIVGIKSEAELYAEEQNQEAAATSKETAQAADNSAKAQTELLSAVQAGIQNGQITNEEVLKAFEEELAKRETEITQSAPPPKKLNFYL